MSRIGNRGELEAFVRAVELGSFSAAARELNLTPSALSKLVTRIERSLKVRLLSRSTRRIAATPEGQLFLARCRLILSEFEDAEVEVRRSRDRPRGKLRMHMGVGFGMSQGVSALARFIEHNPEVDLDLIMEDRRVNLLQENIDVSTWPFPLNAANVVAKKLFDFEQILCASPEYLKRYGAPRTLGDLASHRCLAVSNVPLQLKWHFVTAQGRRVFDVTPSITVSNVDIKYRLALEGAGVAQFNEYIVARALHEGRLVRILTDLHRSEALTLYALYPRDRHRLPRVAAMLDFLVETFSSRPWRRGGTQLPARQLGT